VGLSAAGTTLRMDMVAGTFDPPLTETLAHMFRLDKDRPACGARTSIHNRTRAALDRKTTKEYKRL
jgi:hypothetical protein